MDVEKLRSKFAGKLILPGHGDYDQVRRVFNGCFDKKPGAIAQCRSTSDIMWALDFASSSDIPFAIRAGGHSAAGYSTIDDGLMIDLSQMRGVFVDAQRKRALVEPGATWLEFDRETQAFGLASTGGIISNTGIAGLTLGGGLGWLMGKHGLACDNLVEAHVLLANGQTVIASDDADRDLLWALRGGGGNFGIVTRFEYTLHSLSRVIAGSLRFAPERSEEAMRRYRDLADAAPDDVTFDLALATDKAGDRYAVIDGCWCGEEESGAAFWDSEIAKLAPDRATISSRAYCDWQQNLDDDLRRGRRSYWKGLYLETLSDPVIDTICAHFRTCPSRYTFLTFDHLHGAVRAVGAEATAFSHRHHTHLFLINTNWDHPEEDEKNIAWANALYEDLEKLQPNAEGYVNYLSAEAARIKKAFSAKNYARLRALKARYDPTNLFRQNQNIEPEKRRG